LPVLGVHRGINADLLPKWKSRPEAEIKAEDLLAILNAKVRDGSPVAANRVRALVSRIFTFAAQQRLVPPAANPLQTVSSTDFTLTDCNSFVTDNNSQNWQWHVRAQDAPGLPLTYWPPWATFSFSPCRLSDRNPATQCPGSLIRALRTT
jgi:hypothetical protein